MVANIDNPKDTQYALFYRIYRQIQMSMRLHSQLKIERKIDLRTAPPYNYSRRIILFSSNRSLKVFVKHNRQTFFSFNVCRSYIFGGSDSLNRLGVGYIAPIYYKIAAYKGKFRNTKHFSDRDITKLFGLAKQAKQLNEKNWVFWQDPRTPNGPIYELFPGKHSYNAYFTTKGFIL